jgi:hypothetical protein
MNMALPRPSHRRLEQMLETNPARFEKYLARYPDIADLFEANNPIAGIADKARRAFDAAVDVPSDLAARMRSRINDAESETSPFAIMLDLSGVGLATFKLLADEGPLDLDQSGR